jgi:hypothetical protein
MTVGVIGMENKKLKTLTLLYKMLQNMRTE